MPGEGFAVDVELISRAAAIEAAFKGADDWDGGFNPKYLNELPAVEAVDVVMCKDCMYWKSNMPTHFWKPCDVVRTDKDWYCPCGKRR